MCDNKQQAKIETDIYLVELLNRYYEAKEEYEKVRDAAYMEYVNLKQKFGIPEEDIDRRVDLMTEVDEMYNVSKYHSELTRARMALVDKGLLIAVELGKIFGQKKEDLEAILRLRKEILESPIKMLIVGNQIVEAIERDDAMLRAI